MDKPQELRPGVSRFPPAKRQAKQSGHKLISVLNGGGNVGSRERSKREKVRGSNHIGRGSSSRNKDSEMVGGSEGEVELRQLQPPPPPTTGCTKRTKFPSKPFDECNGVDPAAVPRKLRSAMIKRSCESMSPPLPPAKKLRDTSNSNGIDTPEISGVKKVKQGMNQVGCSDGSLKQPVSGTITKDEEEVVETLYALARLVPDNPVRHQVDGSETKFSPLPEAKESLVPTFEVPEEEHKKLPLPSITAEANITERLNGDPVVSNLTECTTLEQPSITESQKFGMGSIGPATHVDLHRVPLLSETGELPFCIAERLRDPSELCLDTGLVEPKQPDNHLPKRKTENMFWPVTGVGVNQGHFINGTNVNVTGLACTEGGSVLWPGLCTEELFADGIHHSLEWPSSTQVPTWLDTATCSVRPSSAENIVSTEKVSPVVERKQSRKRNVAHIYISHLIREFRTADKTGRWLITSDQLKAEEGMKSGLVANTNPMSTGRHGLNGVISASSNNVSPAEKSLNNQRLGFPLEKSLQQDKNQAATTSGVYASQSQSCNFLSLSSGNGGLEASCSVNSRNKNGNNLVGNGLEQPTQLHVPYLQSLVQNRPLLPFSIPHTRYSYGPYPDQLTAAAGQQVQMHLPQYLGRPIYGPPHLGHAGPMKQQQHLQPPHMWTAQLATQYRSTGIPGLHLPLRHNVRPETSPLIPCPQAIQATTSPTSLEVGLGSKCSPGQQQQHLFTMTSSSTHRGKKQQHHLPSDYEQFGGGFHSEGSSRMQLLCNAEQK
ncbi:hypothetical protein NE237_016515 [Protea cynaroides]|uniref:Uncharacterized protein n=1 Tax=Protea cynaroides TaxID=273540 RepID=A0A9Q0K696_9MAGN|nr:hypothetical protein NE237_016515 [Protea cynaroides]